MFTSLAPSLYSEFSISFEIFEIFAVKILTFKYIKMQDEQEQFIRRQLHLPPEIALAAAELQLAEQINVREEERETYGFTNLLSDTGGAMGLFLGLSLLQVCQWLEQKYTSLLRVIQHRKWFYARVSSSNSESPSLKF